jgi:hypothetical protein
VRRAARRPPDATGLYLIASPVWFLRILLVRVTYCSIHDGSGKRRCNR